VRRLIEKYVKTRENASLSSHGSSRIAVLQKGTDGEEPRQQRGWKDRTDAKEEIQATLSLYLFLRSVPRGVDSSQEIYRSLQFVLIVLIIDHF
jgi:hypothetical protein